MIKFQKIKPTYYTVESQEYRNDVRLVIKMYIEGIDVQVLSFSVEKKLLKDYFEIDWICGEVCEELSIDDDFKLRYELEKYRGCNHKSSILFSNTK